MENQAFENDMENFYQGQLVINSDPEKCSCRGTGWTFSDAWYPCTLHPNPNHPEDEEK